MDVADGIKGFESAGYMGECFWPDVTEEALASADTRARRAAGELTAEGHEVRYLGSVLVADDEVVFFFFDGPSVGLVEEAGKRADIDFARVMRTVGARARRPVVRDPNERRSS